MHKLFLFLIMVFVFTACNLPNEDVGDDLEVEEKSPEKISEKDQLPSQCLEVETNKTEVDKPFHVIAKEASEQGYGYAAVDGKVMVQKEEVWGEIHEKVYLIVEEPATEGPWKNFVDYFMKLVEEGNTVNTAFNGNVVFGLGIYDNDQFLTTADISDKAEAKIVQGIESGERIHLTLTIAEYLGRGAPAEFTFACKIE